jgi:hypothetical protein
MADMRKITVASVGMDVDVASLLAQHKMTDYYFESSRVEDSELLLLGDAQVDSSFCTGKICVTLSTNGASDIALPTNLNQLMPSLYQRVVAKDEVGEPVDLGAYQLIAHQQLLVKGQERIALTDKEVQLLELLRCSYPEPVSKEYLLEHVWGYDASIQTQTLQTHIYRLRQKVGDALIQTQENGYGLEPAIFGAKK